jgi:O-antigen/teichoic acid export membrane protein
MSGSALSILCLPFTPLLLVRGQQRLLFLGYLIGSLAYILSVYVGVRSWGLLGAAAAYPILYVFYFVIVGPFSVREEN